MSLSLKQSRRFLLVDFFLANGTPPVRITSCNTDKFDGTNNYEAHPELEITLPTLAGSLSHGGASIQVNKSRLNFVRELISERASFPGIVARVRECILPMDSDAGVSMRHVEGVIATHRDSNGVTVLNLAGCFEHLDSQAGYVIAPSCSAGYGDMHGCTANPEILMEAGTITTYDGRLTLDIAGLLPHAIFFWMPGIIRDAAGNQVDIHYHRAGTEFIVTRMLPAPWADQLALGNPVAVEVLPGCRKNIPDCNLLNPSPLQFKGIGIGTPNRNPITELDGDQ